MSIGKTLPNALGSDGALNRYSETPTPGKLVIERTSPVPDRFPMLTEMYVERGTKEDYEALHHLHYKSEETPIDPHFYRCMRGSELVGVVVLSGVTLLNTGRHRIFPKIKPGQDSTLTNKYRADFLNKNFRRAARIITSTMYRGVGVSYRMVNLAMRMEGFKYCEIMSSMSKYNPFDEKAGFRRAPLERARAYNEGLKFLREHFYSHPSDHAGIIEEFALMNERLQEKTLKAMRDWYFKHSSREKTGQNLGVTLDSMREIPLTDLVREIQQLTFALLVYGAYVNPDHGRELPKRLPLLAFDRQGVNEPLVLP